MPGSKLPAPLPPDQLRKSCDPASLPFETTAELEPIEEIIGQDRAVRAIRLGLDIRSDGYNIFVVGHSGTGRNTTINRFLEQLPRDDPAPSDLVYVNNFKEPDRPRLLIFPAGRGTQFRNAIHTLVASLRKHLPAVFESDEYERERKAVLEGYRERQRGLLKEFEAKAETEKLRLVQIQMGPIVRPTLVPVHEGVPVPVERLEEMVAAGQLPKEELERIRKSLEALGEELERVLKEVRRIDGEAMERVERLDADVVLPLVHDPLARIRQEYREKHVDLYLEEMEADLLANLDEFREKGDSDSGPGGGGSAGGGSGRDPFLGYRVNLIVDNSGTRGAPVISEMVPTARNLFGAIERVPEKTGEWHSSFTQIRAGSLVRANGGYVVLSARDMLAEPGVWMALKRTLRTGLVDIQAYDGFFPFGAPVLKPEPIPTNVKVLMVGDQEIHALLYNYDIDFHKAFKIKAEFDTVMPATPDAIRKYGGFIAKIVRSDGTAPFDRTGVAAVVEQGMRDAGRRNRISTRFTDIADLVRESALVATRTKAKRVTGEHVREAIVARRERVSLVQTKMQEMVDERRLLIDVDGASVGQVNGLSVYDVGDHSFGLPARITATLSIGRAGILNIERESDLSGPRHNKGVLILTGYLRSLFAQSRPLTLSASLCFEQSYGGIDGDSASSAEMYALLSALSGVPIDQRFAVTGSVDQRGHIQPIGGVNQKIEGWFAACRSLGLTGRQGVLIPVQNVEDLMLDEEVIAAVEAGRFAIYPVRRIEEGIELLTGKAAGARAEDGAWPEGSVYARADRKLQEMAESLRAFGAAAPLLG